MKKNMIIGMALALGILSGGTLSASAAEPCGKCAGKQVVQQFTQETTALSAALKAKDLELREQYSNDTLDTHKISALEAELKGLKDQINATADKLDIPACSRS